MNDLIPINAEPHSPGLDWLEVEAINIIITLYSNLVAPFKFNYTDM